MTCSTRHGGTYGANAGWWFGCCHLVLPTGHHSPSSVDGPHYITLFTETQPNPTWVGEPDYHYISYYGASTYKTAGSTDTFENFATATFILVPMEWRGRLHSLIASLWHMTFNKQPWEINVVPRQTVIREAPFFMRLQCSAVTASKRALWGTF